MDHLKIFIEFVNIIASVFYAFWFFSLEAGNEPIPPALEGVLTTEQRGKSPDLSVVSIISFDSQANSLGVDLIIIFICKEEIKFRRCYVSHAQGHRARKQQDQDSKNDWLQNDILESYYLCKSLTLYRALNVPGSHLMHKLLRISKTVRAVWGLSEHSSLNNCTHCTPIKLVLSRGSGWKHVCFVLELGIKSGT